MKHIVYTFVKTHIGLHNTVNVNVNYGLYLITVYQHWFINNREICRGQIRVSTWNSIYYLLNLIKLLRNKVN